MFGFGRHADTSTYGVLIDIGSGSVGVAIVASNQGEQYPHVLFKHRVFMRITKRSQSNDEGIRRIKEALFSASLILSKEGMQALQAHDPKASPERLFVTCTSPWAHMVARNVQFSQDEPFKFTDDLMRDLLSSAENEIESDLSTTDVVGTNGFTIVERATVDVRINDYQVRQPIGLKGTDVSLSHITGLIPKDILEAIYEIKDKLFPKTEVRAHTSMLVSFCFLRDFFSKFNSFTIINVSAEATEFGIVENGILLSSVYAPYGSNTLVRSIMTKTGKTADDVQSLLRAYADGTLSSGAHEEVVEYVTEYKTAFTKTLKEITETTQLPRTLIVTAHHPLEQCYRLLIDGFLASYDEASYKVIIVDPELMQSIDDSDTIDVFLTISAAFFHKLHGCADIST